MAGSPGRSASAKSASVATLSIDLDAINAALAESRDGLCDVIPKGWFTRAQYEQAADLGQSQAGCALRLLANCGKAETRKFKVMTRGGIKPILHYRLKG